MLWSVLGVLVSSLDVVGNFSSYVHITSDGVHDHDVPLAGRNGSPLQQTLSFEQNSENSDKPCTEIGIDRRGETRGKQLDTLVVILRYTYREESWTTAEDELSMAGRRAVPVGAIN